MVSSASDVPSSQSGFSAEAFFATQQPPSNLEETLQDVRTFVAKHKAIRRKVVLVTSGGTTVPLEHNVVRFLDNFSAGTRGAASAEQFLERGDYAVVFLHRQHSLQPYSRHYSHSTNPFLSLLDIEDDNSQTSITNRLNDHNGVQSTSKAAPPRTGPTASSRIFVARSEESNMASILRSYKRVQEQGLLHSIPYVTVFDYLFMLRGIAQIMSETSEGQPSAGGACMYYLAAAVSDFFIPQQKMSVHKIQSGKGALVIEMDQVPKILRSLVQDWSSNGFIVSFKLETDRDLIIPKARTALERYGHQVVIGNDLHTRKQEVVFVQKSTAEVLRLSDSQLRAGVEIEQEIVDKLAEMHQQHINRIELVQ